MVSDHFFTDHCFSLHSTFEDYLGDGLLGSVRK